MTKTVSPLKNKDKLAKAIKDSKSRREILEKMGLRAAGGNYKSLKQASIQFGFSLPYGEQGFRPALTNEIIFVENSTFNNRTALKKRLYALGVKKECASCGQGPEWNGKPLTLQLDHINGVHNDNRIENLAIVCPNCHSQTDTFAGKNSRNQKEGFVIKPKKKCLECSSPITRQAAYCIDCSPSIRYGTKTKYPDIKTIIEEVKMKGYVSYGKELGVSDNAIRKHLRRNGITNLPKRILSKT